MSKKKNKKATKSFRLQKEESVHKTRMRVIGIGGGGGSIVSEIAPQLKKIDFVVANTDLQALRGMRRSVRSFQFGQKVTHGLGCGMDPKLGQRVALEEKEKISKLFDGIDLCVLVATFGGGTGSGATPEFAKIAKEAGVMTFGIFTMPFRFEGGKKAQVAKHGLERITPHLNAFCLIPNENIFKIIEKTTPLREAFSAINSRLAENLRGLVEMIYLPGLINIDWADLRAVLDGKGKLSYLNAAVSQGSNRAEEAVKSVIKSPLNEYSILGAEKIIYNITASRDLGMKEVEHISQTIADFNKKAKIIFGISQDNSYKDRLRVALLGVGCGEKPKPKPATKVKPKPEPEPEPEPKPVTKPKKKTKQKSKQKPKQDKETKTPLPPKENEKALARKSALDLRKEAEQVEKELLEEEKQWDVPAFLRKKQENNT